MDRGCFVSNIFPVDDWSLFALNLVDSFGLQCALQSRPSLMKCFARFAVPLVCLFLVTHSAHARLLGVDVSSFQADSSMNWTSIKNAGYVFAWAKATEG